MKQNTRKIHVLHLVQCAGGVEKMLQMLLKSMDRTRFEHTLVASDDYNEEAYEGLVDRFVRVKMCNALSPTTDSAAVRAVRKIVRRLRPDIVYCHSSKAGGVGRLACIGLGVNVVYNPHGWAFSMKGSKVKRIIYLTLERMLAPFTTQFVAISNYEKETAVGHGVARPERIKVIYNGVDIQALRQAAANSVERKSLGIREDAYVVGMVGRIAPQKAPDVFLRMADEVKHNIPEAHFMLVGDGIQRHELEEGIRKRKLNNCFTVTGWVDNPAEYVAMMDQVVLLSRWEGFGLVLVEYMVERKPVVATRVGGIPEIITDNENGLLVPDEDAHSAAAAVMKLYNNPTLKAEMIDKAEKKALAMFDMHRMAKEHERLFVNICKRGG